MPRDSVTLLHLSDPQFGKNHRFGNLGLPPPDDSFDSLLTRLTDDLTYLRKEEGLVPDLVVISGDLAEEGKKSEFEDALVFVRGLLDHLELGPDRTVVIPGNHDINWAACEAYFKTCEADEAKPLPPYWPKWRHYLWFFAQLYRDQPGFVFSEEQPWTLFEVPDLELVVAGLNSTMAETHEGDHHGYVGEAQLRWFADALKEYREREWLRIGAVHHNVVRGAKDDDENLKDDKELKRLLGGSLNLLLHGHTHEAELHWLSEKVPIFSTGSAALKSETWPPDVPNQYQFLQIERERLRRWGRAFSPRQKQWILDGTIARNDWRSTHEIGLLGVDGTFPSEAPTLPRQGGLEDREGSLERLKRPPQDDFLTRVARIYVLRHPNAHVERVDLLSSGVSYLSVTREEDGPVLSHPVGAHEGEVSEQVLTSFLAVHQRYRQTDIGCRSLFVHGGETPDPKLEAQLHSEGVSLISFLEYQGLIDFREYVRAQNRKLEHSEQYPPDLYVRQRMQYRLVAGEERHYEDALEEIRHWLVHERHGRFVLILGDFGTGKTFLLRKLALRLGQEKGPGLVPLFVELRSLEKASQLNELIAQHLAKSGVEQIDLPAFRYMLREGRVVLLFDGFDELALRVTYSRAAEHLDTILQAAGGQAKVILTSRTQHFESDEQVRTVLGRKVETVASRVVHLQQFEEGQIHRFLMKLMRDEEKAGERLRLLQEIPDLIGLSKNPRLLSFIAQLDEEDLRKAREQQGVISAAELYRLIVERWLGHEVARIQPRGAAPPLSVPARLEAVTALALKLWTRTERGLSLDELANELSEALRTLAATGLQPGEAAHQVGSGTLLVRDEEGIFSFVHHSILEWLVAREAARRLVDQQDAELLGRAEMSPLMLDFFCDLAGRERVVEWAREVAASQEGSQAAKKNSQALLQRLGVSSATALWFHGEDLQGRDFSGQDLRGADFRSANVSGALFRAADLRDATFMDVVARSADFQDAQLRGANFTSAELSFARLLGADLTGAEFEAAKLYRAALVGAKNLKEGVLPYQGWGAAPPSLVRVEPWTASSAGEVWSLAWSPRGDMLAVARRNALLIYDSAGEQLRRLEGHAGAVLSVSWSPSGDRLASGGEDGSVRVWSLASGEELLQLRGHAGGAWSVSWSPSGDRLASGGGDSSVRVWSSASGEELLQLWGHEDWVSSVSWSPSEDRLASGGEAGSVRVWSSASGEELLQLRGHEGRILSVSWSPLEDRLASGGEDGSVRVWSSASGEELLQLRGHEGGARSVSWSPSGDRLASGVEDGSVRVWLLASGEELLQLRGHEDWVSSVSWSPSGDRLAGGGGEESVRVWSLASGEELLQLRGHAGRVLSVSWSPSGGRLASGGGDDSVRVWSLASGEEVLQLRGHEGGVGSVSWSPSDDHLASGGSDGLVRVWSLDGEELLQLRGHEDTVLSLSWSPAGDCLASGDNDGSLCVWSLAAGEELLQFRGHQGAVLSVSWSPSGDRLASGGENGLVRVWSLDGEELLRLWGHENWVSSVSWSPSGERLASGGEAGSVRVWSLDSGEELLQLRGHAGVVLSVSWSRWGDRLISGGQDGTVRVWSGSNGSELACLCAPGGAVSSITFSPDDRHIAAGREDGTITIWEVETGEHVATLAGFEEGWVAFKPDGRFKLGGDVGNNFWHTVGLVRFAPGELDPYLPKPLRMADDEPLF